MKRQTRERQTVKRQKTNRSLNRTFDFRTSETSQKQKNRLLEMGAGERQVSRVESGSIESPHARQDASAP